MSKVYDATKEHTKFEQKKTGARAPHPNKGLKGKNPLSGKTSG